MILPPKDLQGHFYSEAASGIKIMEQEPFVNCLLMKYIVNDYVGIRKDFLPKSQNIKSLARGLDHF